MSSFEETLARMKGLYTYGKELNEGNDVKRYTLEYHAIAADGKSYGIVKECNKYYIKSAPKDKEMVAESYDYIGGFCNKRNYEYTSYANALKNFELKMASINEACDANVSIATLDPFKKEEFLVEGTEKMRNEIARQRQIMYNASMILNEATEISASRKKDGTVMYDGKNPEAETGKKGDEGQTKATAQPDFKGSNTKGVDKKVGPFNTNPSQCKDQLKEGASCPKCGKNPCECVNCNEEAGDIGDEPLMPNTENWGTEGIGKGRDPKQIGWEMDGQQRVDEEEDDWASRGLPSSPGIGDANTKKNNDPFNKSINENEYTDSEDEEPTDDGDFDSGLSDEEGGDDFSEDEFTDGEEGDEFSDGEENGDSFDDEFDDEFSDDEFGDEFSDEENGDEDLRREIESLRSELELLKAKINGEDGAFDAEDDDFDTEDSKGIEFNVETDGDDFDSGYEFGGEDGEDFSTADEFDDEESGEIDEIGDTPRGQNMLGRLAARQQYRSGQQTGNNGGLGFNGEGGSADTAKYAQNQHTSNQTQNQMKDDAFYSGWNSQWKKMGVNEMDDGMDGLMEAKARKMNSIVESVVNRILKEDELHVFGKHPGYRKKPMELPTTGEDQNQWGRDWNDDSVHSEEPFGKQIGNGDPFDQLVNAVTKDVMYQLKKGVPIEGDKKKVD